MYIPGLRKGARHGKCQKHSSSCNSHAQFCATLDKCAKQACSLSNCQKACWVCMVFFLSPWHLALVDSDLPEQLCQLLVFLHIACCIWIFKSPFLCAAVTRRKIDAMLDQPPQVTVAHLQQKGPRYVKHLRLWQGQRPPAESKDGSTV